ncbi:MAG: hypothetical protein LBB48_00785 [Treponema sp.]|nr:hypothetical protein [Treponema sp.]
MGIRDKERRVYPKEFYKRRNEIERFFWRLKAFRGICARYDKLKRLCELALDV